MSKITAQSISLGKNLALEGASSLSQELAVSLEQVKQQLARQAGELKAQLMAQTRQEVEAVLQQAQRDADAIRQQALADAELLRSQAQTEGYEAGRLAGFEAGHQTVLAELNDILTGVHAFHQAILENESKLLYGIKRDLLTLVQSICEQVLKVSLSENPELWESIFSHALNQFTSQKTMTIVLSDMTVGALQHACGNVALSERYPGVQLLADKYLGPDEAFLICAGGGSHLDLSLTAQVRALLKATKPEQWLTPPDKLEH